MSKSSDFPALRMTIEGGRLVPASAFDQERIDSYKAGSTVRVVFTADKDRPGVRKWWAVLGLALKQCKTPWKNTTEASEAIKLALGIVNLSKTVSGQFMQWPKSLKELDDPELDEAFEQMVALLSKMTGVDVSSLRREAANVGREEEKTPPPADPPPQQPEAPQTPSKAGHTYDEPVRAKLIEFAKKAVRLSSEDITVNERKTILGGMEHQWRDVMPEAEWPKLEGIVKAVRAVINGMRTKREAATWIAEVLECEIETIGGKNV